MSWKRAVAGVGFLVSIEIALAEFLGPIGVGLVLAAALIAWRYIPRFWVTVLTGLIGGFVAGLLILGPGFRLSMRVVAMMDPFRAPEFSPGGTAFIIVGIGGILGAIEGLGGNVLRRALSIESSLVAGTIVGLLFIAGLLVSPGDIRSEFFELGAGPWINIPMFTVFAVAFGVAAMALSERFESGMFPSHRTESEKVAA